MQAPLFSSSESEGGDASDETVVRVALPVPIDSLFDYRIPGAPEGVAEHARPGHRALVPFAGRRLTGVIVECGRSAAAEGDARELAVIDRVVDEEPVVSEEMMGLLRASAAELLCPVGIALNHALPPGAAPRVAHRLGLTTRGRHALGAGALAPASREVLRALADGPLTPATLARRLSEKAPPVRDLTRDGLIEKVQVESAPGAREARERVVVARPGIDVESVCAGPLARAPKQAELLRRIAAAGETATRELTGGQSAAGAALRALAKRGFVELRERLAHRNVLGPPVPRDEPLPLTDEQQQAFERVAGAVREKEALRFLLHGVTGSGKTEVYLRAVATALEAGRQALVLVPEITLTHQIVARLRARFGDELAVLHSGLRPGERLEQWQRLRRGQVPIAVGARSALFAPISDLGIIVVDEEHDGAYKNEEGFKYHARDLAWQRARLAGCPLVLGTATPSLETRYAAERGELERIVLGRRIGGRPLPAVDIVDLVAERARAPRGRKLILTRPLRRAVRETLESGGQTILFLNRRGFSTQVFCFDCGFAERCKDCDVALVYHASDSRLRCHYCDFEKPPPSTCGGCGSPDAALLGLGTERLEEEVRIHFPEARIARLDRDAAARRGYTEGVLAALRDREIDVLVGTQMIAKGHDFPGVQLVGVVAADLGLHMPDFRAAERTFQVLTQVAGRAGRAEAPGRVVLQTCVPDHYAIEPVRSHDYERFYRDELEQRAETAYPPFTRLSQLVVSGPDEAVTRKAIQELAALARETPPASPAPVQVLGPAPSPLARLRGRYRFQLLLKGADPKAVEALTRRVADAARRLPRPLRSVVDVNPGSML